MKENKEIKLFDFVQIFGVQVIFIFLLNIDIKYTGWLRWTLVYPLCILWVLYWIFPIFHHFQKREETLVSSYKRSGYFLIIFSILVIVGYHIIGVYFEIPVSEIFVRGKYR